MLISLSLMRRLLLVMLYLPRNACALSVSLKENGTLLFVSHDTQSVINLCDKAIWFNKGEMISSGKAKAITEKYLQYTLQEVYGDETKLDDIKNNKTSTTFLLSNPKLPLLKNTTANDTFDYNSQYGIDNNLSDANGWKPVPAKLSMCHSVMWQPGTPTTFTKVEKKSNYESPLV